MSYSPNSSPQGLVTTTSSPGTMSLNEINHRLRMMGINARLAPDVARRIRDTEDPARFLKALDQAVNNGSARAWLLNVLRRHGLLEETTGPAPAQGEAVSAANTAAARPNAPSPMNTEIPDYDLIDPDRQNEASGRLPIEDRLAFHVYGRKAALCFNADVTRKNVPTVALDGAMAKGKNFDWQNKIRIQLTRQELPEVLSVLLGYKPGCKFKNHGPDKSKGFSIVRQPGQFFVNVSQKGKPLVAVPMTDPDSFYVSGLLMRQLAKIYGQEYMSMLPFLLQRYAMLGQAPLQ